MSQAPHFGDTGGERRLFSLDVHRKDGDIDRVGFVASSDIDSAVALVAMNAGNEAEQAAATMDLFLDALVDDDGLSIDYEPGDGEDIPGEQEWSSRRRFWAIMQAEDRWISLRVLRKVGEWLMEGAVDLPTQQPGQQWPGQQSRRPGPTSRASRR
jgi:hypothetical protein